LKLLGGGGLDRPDPNGSRLSTTRTTGPTAHLGSGLLGAHSQAEVAVGGGVDSERRAGAWPGDGAGLTRAGEQLGLQVAHGVESHGQKLWNRKRDRAPPCMLGQVVSAIGRAG
jgi:hypothetical protein